MRRIVSLPMGHRPCRDLGPDRIGREVIRNLERTFAPV
jgi:hypothetical protein